MEMHSCPVLHPTQEEFGRFSQYVHFLDNTYKKDYGMVKVVPPASWKAHSVDYDQRLEHLVIKNAIEQNVYGLGGYFEVKNMVQPKMSFKAYKKYAVQESSKVDGKTAEQKQHLFWKTITYSPPIYGADLTGTLMDATAKDWNFNCLDSLLKHAFLEKIRGVNEPYCYIGTWKAFFSWHKEDMDLSAINYIHEGAPKIWYSIAESDGSMLEEEARCHFKSQYHDCKQFLRHKTFLINPQVLLRKKKDIKITRVVHNPGEIMIVFGGAYHCGFNCGFNIAQAVNYATTDWFKKLINTRACGCSKRSVRAQLQCILYNLQESEIFQKLLLLEGFQMLRAAVQVMQQRELQTVRFQGDQKQKDQIDKGLPGAAEREREKTEKDLGYQDGMKVSVKQKQNLVADNNKKDQKKEISKKSSKKKIKKQKVVKEKKQGKGFYNKISKGKTFKADQSQHPSIMLKNELSNCAISSMEAKLPSQSSIHEQLI